MTETQDGLPLPQRYWAILTLGLGIFMAVMDGAIANVALPTIAQDLHVSPSASVWVINGYQLAITVSLLSLASLGDIIGYRRVYLAGLLLFTLASLACAMTHSLSMLVLARVAQGFGAAGIMSVMAALVRFTYPHRLLGQGIGINALLVAVSAATGPTVASGILSIASWPLLFAINVPFGAVALAIGMRALPHSPRGRHAFDGVSALLNAMTFGLSILAIDGFGRGEAPPVCLSELSVALIAGIVLVRRQRHATLPLLPVDLLRIPIFALSLCSSVTAFCAQMLAFVALPFFLRDRFGFSAVEIGLLMTPWPIAIGFAAFLAARLVERYPAGLLGGIGLLLFAGGLLMLGLLPPHPAYLDIVWRMALTGIGFGFFQSPNNRTMIAAAPRERSGGASGLLGTARLVGQTVGAALVGLLLARYAADGTRIAVFTGAGFALAGAMASMLRLSPAGARGAGVLRVVPGQRAKGE